MGDAGAVDPAENLGRPEWLVAMSGECRFERRTFQLSQVGEARRGGHGISHLSKNLADPDISMRWALAPERDACYSVDWLVIPSRSMLCGTPDWPREAPGGRCGTGRSGCELSPSAASFSLSNSPIVRDLLDNGLRVLTEQMTQVRSISIGVWLTRGSRPEAPEQSGIAHFVEHMLFKGTATRSAEDIAQAIASIGGQLDAFTAKEYASHYIKVLDQHLPLAIDILSDIVRNPAFSPEDIEREKKVVVEEIKMVEDTPDDLVHELFTQRFWENHALGRPILATRETVESFNADLLRAYFTTASTPRHL